MPGLDGCEVARAIVRELGAECPRLLVMTAAESGRAACLSAGVDEVLAKPLGRQALAAALARVRPAAAAPEDFNVSAWVELCRVFRAGGAAQLVEAALADLPEQRRRHAAAAQAGDLAALGRIAHALRGASLQFGAAALAELCGRAEAACAAQDPGAALRSSAAALARYAALVGRLALEAQAGGF
jgi:HPt (histidine-containing phosphotransfer) domain-containing protein